MNYNNNFPSYFAKSALDTLEEVGRNAIKTSAYFLAFNITESKRNIENLTQTDPLKKGIIEFNNVKAGERFYEVTLIPDSNLDNINSVSPFRNGIGSISEDNGVIDILIANIQVSRSNELRTITPVDRNGYSSYINSVSGNMISMSIMVTGGYTKEDQNWLFVSTLLKHQEDYIIFEFDSEFLKTILPKNKLLLTNVSFQDSSDGTNMIELQLQFVDVNENLKLF